MATGINTTMGLREWAMLVTLSIFWGGSFFFVEVAVDALPPLTIAALRVGLAVPVLWFIVVAAGLRPPRSFEIWRSFLVMGVINNAIPFSLIIWGQIAITSSLASILNATTPLFTLIVANALLADERATPVKYAGVAIGFVGVVTIFGSEVLHGIGFGLLAQTAVLGAALAYAFAGVYGRRFRRMGVAPIVTAAGQVTASTCILVPIALVIEAPVGPMPDLTVWAAIVGLATISTAFAYVLYFQLLATVGATNLMLVTFMIPVSAILLGWSVLGERLSGGQWVGMVLIGLGLAVVDGRAGRWIRPR